jgi:hypothetical protein
MTIIKKVQPLNPEEVFGLLLNHFTSYINDKLGSNLEIEYAHVYDVINISFPEVIQGNAFTLIVSDDELTLSANGAEKAYNSDLLEEYLITFLTENVS